MWKPVAEQITVSYYNKIHRTSPTLQQSLYNAVSNSWFKSLIAHTPCSPVTCPKKPSGRKETRQDSASVLPRHPIVATFNIASPELHGLCLPAPYGSVCVCVCVCVRTFRFETHSRPCAAPVKTTTSPLSSCIMCTYEQTVRNKLENL